MNMYVKSFVIGILMLSLGSNSASAAFFDLAAKRNTSPVRQLADDEQNWSFDQLYANIKQLSFEKKLETPAPIQDISVVPVLVPVTKEIKTQKAVQKIGQKTYLVSMTAYSSTPDQTDSTPFITASNTYVRDGIVAANFLPFGTAIKIPDLYGDKIFVVEDRMNRRYTSRVDIWFPDRASALQFGLKRSVRIEVI